MRITVLAALVAAALALRCPAQLEQQAPVDVDGDGAPEVEALRWLDGEGDRDAPAVAVLVEPRLLAQDADGALRARLQRLLADLAAEGHRAELVEVTLQSGRRHQDGLTLLGLRRVLAAWHAREPGLRGVILVGRFPDAFLVRTCNWRKHGKVTAGGREFADVPYLRRVPEVVAPRCDLVLADLDGDWEARYTAGETALPTLYAVFEGGVPAGGGAADAVAHGEVRNRDFFHVDDGAVALGAAGAVAIDDDARDHECTPSDRVRGNPLALPEICVSRIDARGVAWSPVAEIAGLPLLDDAGAPRAIELPKEAKPPHWQNDVWRPDPELELRLLCEHLDRNHRYRTAGAGDSFRPASIAHGLPSGFRQMKAAADEWRDFALEGYDLHRGVDLVDVVEWLRRPAVLRTLRAHSDARRTVFARTPDAELAAVLGGDPLCWAVQERRLVPSLRAATRGDSLGFFLLRTLWENAALPDHPYLMIHTGCEALAPPGARSRSYDDPRYGAFPNAESLLFLTPCVALVGRAKVFYDEPRGFTAALRDGATFGDAWRRYFELESRAASWGKVGGDIGRKRSYFWSVVGDWTLRLQR